MSSWPSDKEQKISRRLVSKLIMPSPDDDEKPNEEEAPHHYVELATLSLPSQAVTDGLVVGDGQQVVLEAASETVEHINTSDTQMISGVVDLEVLSELVGATEEDFIAGLHHNVQEQREEEEEANGAPDETSPLIPQIP